MNRKLNPDIIRIGDKVKIVKPDFFVRCGYDNDHESACKHIIQTKTDEIIEFILKIRGNTPIELRYYFNENKKITGSLLFDKIVSALAYQRVGNLKESGMERKIYTTKEKWIKGRIFIVDDIFFCKTGIYYMPVSHRDYWTGEIEFDPGGLNNEKTHKMLRLADAPIMSCGGYPPAIEAINVRKIQ